MEESAATTTLDPCDWIGFREQAHRMLDDMLGDIETIRERPVWQTIPDEARARFRLSLPHAGASLRSVRQQTMTAVLPRNGRRA